jgi:hypothetical protein
MGTSEFPAQILRKAVTKDYSMSRHGQNKANARWRVVYCCQKLLRFAQLLLVKGKAVPLQPWTGPEGSRRLRLPDFKTIST